MSVISRTEEMLLLAVCKLADDAYGLSVRKEVKRMTGKLYSIGGIYVPLDRLVEKGLLDTLQSGPTPERGGRRKRLYRITAEGIAALEKARAVHRAMWSGVPELALLKRGLS